ncbi:MAG: hypothetical protein DESF_00900 [Desulfovibrio sp.]
MSAYSTGLELVLNAAEGVLQIIVTDDEKLLCAQEWRRADRATEILAPALDNICTALDIRPADFRRLACVRGPGSFTGIRLVLATAAALRRAGKAGVAGLDYMQALATTAVQRRQLLFGAPVWAITHARRNLVHCQLFLSYGPMIPAQPLAPVELCTPQEALARILDSRTAPLPQGVPAGSRIVWACGSGLARNAAAFSPLDPLRPSPDGSHYDVATEAAPVTALDDLVNPDIQSLCLLARHGEYTNTDPEPFYVRPCDAVENLPQLAPRQGLTSETATAALELLLRRPPRSDI